MSVPDFMALDGWGRLGPGVGGRAAHFYEHVLGFTLTAHCGPEAGLRDLASPSVEATR